MPMREPKVRRRCADLEGIRVVIAEAPSAGERCAFEPRIEEDANLAEVDEKGRVIQIVDSNGRHDALIPPCLRCLVPLQGSPFG